MLREPKLYLEGLGITGPTVRALLKRWLVDDLRGCSAVMHHLCPALNASTSYLAGLLQILILLHISPVSNSL